VSFVANFFGFAKVAKSATLIKFYFLNSEGVFGFEPEADAG
jgi:hypothetical protein